ncbi:hypothetical protein ACJMK2_035630 [Sinanodonta woodiana]|uniref:CCHC-type domain-containing protein n=1 Tax=Sinanodonta woodiana TaxID=1069815 RepID=A0ABD3WZ03_SINWO
MFRKFDVNLSPYVDCDIYHKTLRVEGRISREEALRRLNHAGIATKDIEGMYREGENSPWNAVLCTKEQAYGVQAEGIKYLAKMVVDLRVHWLPLYISDDIIREVLSPFGKVLDITRDKTVLDKDVVTFNGTRLVKLQTTEFDSRNIPHIVSLGQCGMLITMKGRAPICLKCRQSGHLRKDCPDKVSTYASVATSKPLVSQSQPSTAVPQVPATPAPHVLSPPDLETPTSPEPQEPLADKSTTAEPSTSNPVLTAEELEILSKADETELIEKTPTEFNNDDRKVLFDADALEWTLVRNPKRMKTSNHPQEDNQMDISVQL